MHGATLTDKSDRVLRPCTHWNDSRAAGEAEELDAEPGWRSVSGNIVFPGFTAPSWFGHVAKRLTSKIGLKRVSCPRTVSGCAWQTIMSAKRPTPPELVGLIPKPATGPMIF